MRLSQIVELQVGSWPICAQSAVARVASRPSASLEATVAAGDCAEMHERIRTALHSDEAVALVVLNPPHCALRQHDLAARAVPRRCGIGRWPGGRSCVRTWGRGCAAAAGCRSRSPAEDAAVLPGYRAGGLAGLAGTGSCVRSPKTRGMSPGGLSAQRSAQLTLTTRLGSRPCAGGATWRPVIHACRSR